MPKITIFLQCYVNSKNIIFFFVKILFMMQDVVLAKNIAFCAYFAQNCAKLVAYDAEYCAKLVPLHARMMRKMSQK